MKNITIRSFKRAGDNKLPATIRLIIGRLKADQRFAPLAEQITATEKALTEYDEALTAAAGGERSLIVVKNTKREIVRSLMADLAISVQQLCKGDEAMLVNTGFDLRKVRSANAKKPFTLEVGLGLPGEATVRVQKVPKTRAYAHQYTTDPLTAESIWRSENDTSNEHTFRGLPSGVKLWFRVVIFDKDGKSTPLAPVARITQ